MSNGLQSNKLSPSELKRLFYIWFNSISNDNKSLNLSQFSSILNRIFSSSISSLSPNQISKIFNKLSNNTDTIYYNEFLSTNEHTFINIMTKILEDDYNAISALCSVPNISINNASNNTLQQLLHDQTEQIFSLQKWIIEIGLPSSHRTDTLREELTNIIEDKSRLDEEMKLIQEQKTDLQTDAATLNRSYSLLNDNYTYSVQQITDLKSMNTEYKLLNEKLQNSLTITKNDLLNQQKRNKEYDNIIENLTKLNEQYKKKHNQLTQQNDSQLKQIMNLSVKTQQLEVAMESTMMALEQKTEQINKLQNELETQQQNNNVSDVQNDTPKLSDEQTLKINEPSVRFTVTDTSMKTNTNVIDSFGPRKSYLFVRTPMVEDVNSFQYNPFDTMVNDNDNESVHSNHSTVPIFFRNTSKDIDAIAKINTITTQSDCKKLYHDEKNNVDVYVFTENDENKLLMDDKDEFVMLDDDVTDRKSDVSIDSDMKLKEMEIKHELEIIKLKQEIETLKKKENILVDSKPLIGKRESVEIKFKEKKSDGKNKNNKKKPKDFNDQQLGTSCVLFGWNLW